MSDARLDEVVTSAGRPAPQFLVCMVIGSLVMLRAGVNTTIERPEVSAETLRCTTGRGPGSGSPETSSQTNSASSCAAGAPVGGEVP